MPLRSGRCKGADARRDSNRGVQRVIDQQGGAGQKSWKRTQIFVGDGIGTAALRIGCDSLAVRKIDDDQQDDNAQRQRKDVRQARETKRNEQGKRSFRPVCSRAEGIQTEDGNTLRGTDLLAAFFRGGKRPSN